VKTAAIMQPTYLPWIGYFSLMDQVDTFVFLDSVQFDKRSWQQRNRIKTAQGELFLTVPVITKGRRFQKISEAEIDPAQHFQEKQLKTIENNYSKAPFFDVYWEEFSEILKQNYRFLVDLNVALIEWFKIKLGIESVLIKSSSLKAQGQRVDLLVSICRKTGINHYLSPMGYKRYIKRRHSCWRTR
jgi:hypothetical protein